MRHLLSMLCLLPSISLADVPRVVTDIAPIHSLTAQVMGDLGDPGLLLPPGTDPHDFALRPSDAEALGDADLVIWVGHGLTPWLEEPLETLAGQATTLELLELPGWEPLPIREVGTLDEHAGHDGHDHGSDAHDDHDDHGHEAAGHHDHDHGDFDPHAWVDADIAKIWLSAIADTLSAADPDNADTYAANAAAASTAIDALDVEIATRLSTVAGAAYILPHDGYQYFETRYGLQAHGAIAGADARTPGPAQVAALRDKVTADNVACVFSDTEIGDRWADLVIEGTAAKTATLDGVGTGLDAGPQLYAAMLERLATAFETCLG